MRNRRDGSRSRWDQPPSNQMNEWPPYQSNFMPPPASPWTFPQGQFSELDQFQSAYQSDRFVNYSGPYWNQNTYQATPRNDFLMNAENNWESGRNNSQNPRPNKMPSNDKHGPQDPFSKRNPISNSASVGTKKTQSDNRSQSRNEENYPKDQGPSNSQWKESYRRPHNERPSFQSEKGPASNKKESKSNVSPTGPLQKRPTYSSVVGSTKTKGKGLNDKIHILPPDRKGNNGHHGRGGFHGTSLLGRPPPPFGRGGFHGTNLLGRPPPLFGHQNQFRWSTPRNENEEEEDDESNEINHWLLNSKGQESLNERDRSPVNKDPLPGSEEARTNAIKEATDRLKQALKQKKNVNLNELLSSGDEAKGDGQASSKQKSYPKNLAQLELDASDMRAIGRANTEKANCGMEDDYDDDIVEVARPPPPVRPIIDLDVTPTKGDRDHSEKEECIPRNGNVCPQVQSFSQSQSEVESAQGIQEDISQSNKNLTENCVTKSSLINLESIKDFSSNTTTNGSSCVSKTVHLNDCRDDTEVTLGLADLSTKPLHETNYLTQSGSKNVDNMKVSCRRGSLNQSVSETTEKPSSSCFSEKLSSDAETSNLTSSVDRGSLNFAASPPSTFNQRRRRNSSTCESPNYRSPRLGNPRPQQTRSSPFEPRSPPFLQQGIHDSRQKKIISDLQRMSQSKLKDLINNPRSGKLDFAMRQLMKEHRASISRKSRDVAEKRIPAEFLIPKSTDLPPDDSTLLADFAIDWSSLPGELISTLGDLFQDFNSEITTVPLDSQLQNSNDSCKLDNAGPEPEIADLSVCDQESPLCNTRVNQEGERNESTVDATSKAENTPPIKIRVRQFAREHLFPVGGCDEMNLHRDQTENVDSALFSRSEEAGFIEPVSGENALNTNISNTSIDTPGSCGSECVEKLNLDTVGSHKSTELQDTHQHSHSSHSLERNTNQATANHNHEQESTNCETIRLSSPMQPSSSNAVNYENGNIEKGTSPTNILNSVSNVRSNVKKSPEVNKSKKNQTKTDNNKSPISRKNNRHKQKRFVHLEERTWFEDSHAERNVTNPIEPPRNSNGNRTESEDNHSSNQDNVNDGTEGTSIVSNISNILQDNANDGTESTPIVSNISNILPADKQFISMLPVLMMTVPANGLPDVVYNMNATEMQKRLDEIDIQLQNLVQERFILSQALKTIQSSDVNNEAVAIPSDGNNHPIVPTNEIVCTVPCSSTASTVGSNVGQEMPKNRDVRCNIAQPSKRKCSANDDKPSKKKRKSSLKTPSNNTSKNSKALIKDCIVQKNIERSSNKSEVIVLDDDDDDYDDDKDEDKDNDDRSANSENEIITRNLTFIKFPNVEGNILNIKIHDKYIYAASDNGLLYCISLKFKIEAIFGKKGTCICTSVEVVSNPGRSFPYVFTGGTDGILRVYETQTYPSEKRIHPDATHFISNAIHCMEVSWGMLYMGTRAGSVVPFSVKNGSVGEPISLGGFPVLAIKSCMEGPRKVLVVACRNQPIAIRDAVSGLLLRTLGECNWSVYSIAIYKNWVLCGANSAKISVFDFQSGELVCHLSSGMGVVDLRLIGNCTLLAGCYNGRIYAYDLQQKTLLGSYKGPGNMIICLDIIKKKIICSSKDSSLSYCFIPKEVRKSLSKKRINKKNL